MKVRRQACLTRSVGGSEATRLQHLSANKIDLVFLEAFTAALNVFSYDPNPEPRTADAPLSEPP